MSRVCNKMVIAFAIVTLFCMNGCNKKTVSALLSTLCVLAMVMTVFSLVVHHTEELDFSTMEYLDLRSIVIIRKKYFMQKYYCPGWVPLWMLR